jgi:purine-binding chemotaxis protein CheW
MENTIAPHVQQNVSVVAFKLNQRTFALPLEVIMQILPMMTITPIPHLSNIVKGTINIRGEDVLVISLRSHFNMEDVEPQLYTPLLLLKLKDRSLALIVDAVLDVMNLPLDTLTDLEHMMPEGIENIPLLQGISHYNDDTILVLDPANLFYNHRTLVLPPVELRTSVSSDTPVNHTPIEDTLVPPAAAKKPVAKKAPAVKKTPIVEEAPAVESAPAVEEPPAAMSAPAEDTPAPLPLDPPKTENE